MKFGQGLLVSCDSEAFAENALQFLCLGGTKLEQIVLILTKHNCFSKHDLAGNQSHKQNTNGI